MHKKKKKKNIHIFNLFFQLKKIVTKNKEFVLPTFFVNLTS